MCVVCVCVCVRGPFPRARERFHDYATAAVTGPSAEAVGKFNPSACAAYVCVPRDHSRAHTLERRPKTSSARIIHCVILYIRRPYGEYGARIFIGIYIYINVHTWNEPIHPASEPRETARAPRRLQLSRERAGEFNFQTARRIWRMNNSRK